MTTPEESSTVLSDTPAPAVEESKQPSSPEEGEKSVAEPKENNQPLQSQDETMVSKEEDNEKVLPEVEDNQKVATQEVDNQKVAPPEDDNEMESQEEKNQEVASQEGNNKADSQNQNNEVVSQEEDTNQKAVTEEVSNDRTDVSLDQSNETSVPDEQSNQELPSHEENTPESVPHEEDSSQRLSPQKEQDQTLVSPEDTDQMAVPQHENSEMVTEEGNSKLAVPQQENSEMAVPQEELNETVVTEEEDSEMAEPPQESSQIGLPQEKSEMVVIEEEKSELAAPQEDINEMGEPEVESSEVSVPQEDHNEVVVTEEEKNEVAMHQQENSEIMVPEEANIEVAPPQDDNTQLVVPQEESTQMLTPHEDDNTQIDTQMIDEDTTTQMIPSNEDNKPQMMISHDDNSSQLMMTDEHHMVVSHEENHHQMLMSHEENNNDQMVDGNHHHMGDQLMVMEEDSHNNQLMIPHHDEENNSQLMLPNDDDNSDLVTPDSRPNKRRRKKSVVWEHFTIETVGDGCRRACCKQCKQSFAYSTGSKVAGTSHLKRHIAKGTCLALLRNHGHPQMLSYNDTPGGATSNPPKRRYRSPNSSSYFPFDSDRCRHEIAKMIIMHDYPLHMVEHAGFMTFVSNLQPRFGMVSFNTVQGDCVATYLREKQNVMKFIEGLPGRVTLTLDMWTSCESIGYVFITGHFIDSDWKPQKKMLNVVMEPYPDSDAALSHAVACCLSDWSLEGKLFSVTFNHPVGDAGLESLLSLLCIKNTRILNGQLVLGNCISHTLTSMAKELLSTCRDLVSKIRDSVKYVKTLESHEDKFLDLKRQLQVPSDKSLQLDDQSQWNTTYEMLLAASELKEVFSCLDTSDPHYKEAPSMLEWKQVEMICSILKHLVDAANLLSSSTNPIAITFFHEAWRIQAELSKLAAIGDPFINNFIKELQDKIEKYIKDCSLALAVAVVMDPRFKMKLVEFSFSKIYGDDAPAYIKIVDDGVHDLFKEYVALPLPLTPTYEENADPNLRNEENQQGAVVDNGLADFDVYIMESTSHQTKSELDMYLDDSLLPRVSDFDVLGWWRQNKMKYPTLSKMARDILSIPVSTATAENVFDSVLPREVDRYRSSLRPETVEALVCAKDWLIHGAAAAAEGGAPSVGVVKMEL
ncbi:unnamed protein product [Linum trigynum]|uniref:BED-type domain-containing protein n=1 Tax=Linum trigynum TaxID=586398 RepID=A0AAV2CSD0_9ROSI